MAKKNAPAVAVMPVRDDPETLLLQNLFRLTVEECSFLNLCADSAPRPSDCTVRQRLLFRKLEKRRLVMVVEYPFLDSPRWVLSQNLGGLYADAATRLTGVSTARIVPTDVLHFPSPR